MSKLDIFSWDDKPLPANPAGIESPVKAPSPKRDLRTLQNVLWAQFEAIADKSTYTDEKVYAKAQALGALALPLATIDAALKSEAEAKEAAATARLMPGKLPRPAASQTH